MLFLEHDTSGPVVVMPNDRRLGPRGWGGVGGGTSVNWNVWMRTHYVCCRISGYAEEHHV